ncbi:anthranilate synthase component 2 [Filimonas sp.]|nr:anthranilate synthase component 2 [Filimonas sp.]
MKVLLIDNYDSFTFNIVELLRQLGISDFTVMKNDEVNGDSARTYDKLIISPGPAIPSESGNILDIIQTLAPTHSILGICLGHQAIAQTFGAKLRNEAIPYHGFQTEIKIINEHRLFRCKANPIQSTNPDPQTNPLTSDIEHLTSFKVGLYHSWSVDETDFPSCLEITSYSKEGNIMSLRHKQFDVHGVQFHPESYMTSHGKALLANFLFCDDN